MPVLALSPVDFLPPGNKFAPMQVLAVMLYPIDETGRRRLLVSLMARSAAALSATGGKLIFDSGSSALLLEATDPFSLIDKATEPVIRGSKSKGASAPSWGRGKIAASILRIAIELDQEEPGNVGSDRCLRELSEVLKKRGSQNSATRDLLPIWREYRPAAHLWAAAEHFSECRGTEQGQAMLGPDDSIVPLDLSKLQAFLTTAEWFRAKGEAIKNRHDPQRKPFLPIETSWCLPESLSHLKPTW